MIDREYLQSLRELHQGCRVAEIPESVFDELCRVYLAWLDAPEGKADNSWLSTSVMPAMIPAYRTSLAYSVGFNDGKKQGCGRCYDITKPCDISGGNCAAEVIKADENVVFDLLKESRTAVRQLGWKGDDYTLPHEWRMLAQRYERGEFQAAMDWINAASHGEKKTEAQE